MDFLNEQYLFEMANVKSTDTGLPYDIWIDSLGKDRTLEHNTPRIKVNVNGKYIPIEISDEPDIPESVKKKGIVDFDKKSLIIRYIKAYKDIFLAHYNKQISDKQALELLGTFKEVKSSMLKFSDMIDINPNKIIEYCWDEDNLLYEISIKSRDRTIETVYAISDTELFIKLGELKQKYDVNSVEHIK